MTAPEQHELATLAAGRVSSWKGIPGDCSRCDVEATFGPSEPGPDGLDGSALSFRDYPPAKIAPHGLTAWYSGDQLRAVRIVLPTVAAAEFDALPTPDLVEPSDVAPLHDHLAWPGLGLSLHRHRYNLEVQQLYAYQPMQLEAYRSSWIAHVAVRRTPMSG